MDLSDVPGCRNCKSRGLDEYFVKRAASTFIVTIEGDGMAGSGVCDGDTLIVDRSRSLARPPRRCRYRWRSDRSLQPSGGASNQDPLPLIKRGLVVAPVVDAGGAGGFVVGHLLGDRVFATVVQIFGDPGGSKAMGADSGVDAEVGGAARVMR